MSLMGYFVVFVVVGLFVVVALVVVGFLVVVVGE